MNDKQEAKFQELTGQPVGHLVCKMAVPTIISMMVTACYNMVDTYFVGQLHSNSATGAVGVVFSLMAVIQAVGFFFGHGSGNYISRQLGRHETADAEKMAATGVTLAFLAGCVILVLGQIFLTPLARLLGSTDTILPYARSYLRIILLGAPYMTASFVLNNQLRFQGSAAYGMVGIAAGAVLNVGLDPLLIFGLNMGVAGAALATILSQLASFCMLLLAAPGRQPADPAEKSVPPPGPVPGDRQGRSALPVPPGAGQHRHHLPQPQRRAVWRRGHCRHERGKPGHDAGPVRPDRLRPGIPAGVRLQLWRGAVSPGEGGLPLLRQVVHGVPDGGFGAGPGPGSPDHRRVPQRPGGHRLRGPALRLQCLAFPLCGVIVISSMLTQTINKVWQASVLAAAGRGCSSSRRCWPCPISGGNWGCSWPSRCRTCAPSP